MRIKICGINTAAAFDAAAEAGADYVGLVFCPVSPRFVTPAQAATLSARATGGPKRVGLFVAPGQAAIEAALSALALDVLQIHGVADVSRFRRFGLPLWRAQGVAAASDLPATTAGADELLLDAKPPRGADRPGGNATSFDWRLLPAWHPPAPWWLAGGLTPHNVTEAIRISGATAVDVSSGVESAPGVKDAALIRAFVRQARG